MKSSRINHAKNFRKKMVNVMVSLTKIWQLIETATKSNSEKVELNLEDFKNLTEQTIGTIVYLSII